ncbi:DUF503 domain-containing protein [Alkalibacter rhizosphaerae]|uniref:DUF503 domain-containing protein n=1 Tax=Alkalibacter rhizosphaerae TaxID=2815577 RepID=A0A974XIH7_9FIRM|nr:DUF503 domain-containing protein [Alkalibacter rhizosphaerae]QSX09375.1 DUF503 domain-containing protein [Alkalibacter rhizosphaerae]
MFVMGCVFKLRILESGSLKEKRRIIKGLMEKIRNRYRVSVVEAGAQDLWDQSEIGCAFGANHAQDLENRLEKILQLVETTPQVEIVEMVVDTIKLD